MPQRVYFDFDLWIESAAQGYRVQVNSLGGQATHLFSLPFSDQDIEIFILRIGQTRRHVRRIDSPELRVAKDFGERLFATVFAGAVRDCFRSCADEADRQGGGLRIRLRLNDVPQLADLPWEYLYDKDANRFLALSVDTPVVRYLELPARIRPLAVIPPLRLLAIITSPKGYPTLDVIREWTKLQTALHDLEQRGLIQLELLEHATLAALQRRLRQGTYHILHFMGHGGFDQQIQDGVLLLEDATGDGHRVSGQDLATLLHDHRSLRLVMLNACEGGRTARDDPFAGVAQSLVLQGIPAVIAMQFEVTDEAAISLAQEFYGAVADGYPVDAALTEARKSLFAAGNSVEWGTPVLYLRSPDGRIFDIASSPLTTLPQPPISPQENPATEVSPQLKKIVQAPRTVNSTNRSIQSLRVITFIGFVLILVVSLGLIVWLYSVSRPSLSNASTTTQPVVRTAVAEAPSLPATTDQQATLIPASTATSLQSVVRTAAPSLPVTSGTEPVVPPTATTDQQATLIPASTATSLQSNASFQVVGVRVGLPPDGKRLRVVVDLMQLIPDAGTDGLYATSILNTVNNTVKLAIRARTLGPSNITYLQDRPGEEDAARAWADVATVLVPDGLEVYITPKKHLDLGDVFFLPHELPDQPNDRVVVDLCFSMADCPNNR